MALKRDQLERLLYWLEDVLLPDYQKFTAPQFVKTTEELSALVEAVRGELEPMNMDGALWDAAAEHLHDYYNTDELVDMVLDTMTPTEAREMLKEEKSKYRAVCEIFNLREHYQDATGEDESHIPEDAYEYTATLYDEDGNELDSWDSTEGYASAGQTLTKQQAEDACIEILRDVRAGHAHRWFNYDADAEKDGD